MMDLAVLGAGPAGIEAALAAGGHGLAVTLIDEAQTAGGQVFRAPAPRVVGDSSEGDALRSRLAASPVAHLAQARAWLLGREGTDWRIDIVRNGQASTLRARALVLATGAIERVVPFPGWTLPGVVGLAGATIMLKAAGMAPGQRVVVAGNGPLLVAVAASVLKRGAQVVAVVDGAGRADWLRALPRVLSRPDLVRTGLSWLAAIRRAGVPTLHRYRVLRAIGTDRVTAVEIAGASGQRLLEADALAIGHGLIPDTAATRLLRLPHRYAPALGGWVPERDETTLLAEPMLWLAGDGAGVRGAAAAALQGRLAGFAAAHALGALPSAKFSQIAAALRRRIARAEKFGAAWGAMCDPDDAAYAAIPPETIVCRCEDISRAELEAAIDAGATEANQLKQFTRCGMGPCQGRYCGHSVGALLALRGHARAQFTGRAPLRPVPLDALLGDFDYSDIPVPEPAPV
jgi:thioredoxin reductase/bacterioferritin-associated ferredoxin